MTLTKTPGGPAEKRETDRYVTRGSAEAAARVLRGTPEPARRRFQARYLESHPLMQKNGGVNQHHADSNSAPLVR